MTKTEFLAHNEELIACHANSPINFYLMTNFLVDPIVCKQIWHFILFQLLDCTFSKFKNVIISCYYKLNLL